jgi:adenylosuccinate synthase
MPNIVVIGAQWGDEGKGKIIDVLASNAKHIVKAQGGNNEGHTIVLGKEEYTLQLIPSGILHPNTQCYIAAGTVIDPEVLVLEINALQSRGILIKDRLKISPYAHIIFPYHRKLDLALEQWRGIRAVGAIGRGIGPCYADKAYRLGIRLGEMLDSELFPKLLKSALALKNEQLFKVHNIAELSFDEIHSEYIRYGNILRPYIDNVEEHIHKAMKERANILFEGSEGTLLDTTFGTYPFATPSSTLAGGICAGAGIGPSNIDHTIGIFKSYTTRPGIGPLPSELKEEERFFDTYEAREITIQPIRKIGWFDAILAKTAVRLNGLDSIALAKLDILDKLTSIKICVGYEFEGKQIDYIPLISEDLEKVQPIYETLPGWQKSTTDINSFEQLPIETRGYLKRIEELCEIPISLLSIGQERAQTIELFDPFSTVKRN